MTDRQEPTVNDHAVLAAAWLRSAAEAWIADFWNDIAPDIGDRSVNAVTDVMLAMLPTDPPRDKVEKAYGRFERMEKERRVNDE